MMQAGTPACVYPEFPLLVAAPQLRLAALKTSRECFGLQDAAAQQVPAAKVSKRGCAKSWLLGCNHTWLRWLSPSAHQLTTRLAVREEAMLTVKRQLLSNASNT